MTGDGILGACFLNGNAYYAVEDPDSWQIVIYTLDESGTCRTLSGFDAYQAQQDSAFLNCYDLMASPDGSLWMLTYHNERDCLLRMDAEGNVLKRKYFSESVTSNRMCFDKNGNLYCQTNGNILVMDAEGETLAEISHGLYGLVGLRDGRAAAIYKSEDGESFMVQPVNDSYELAETYQLTRLLGANEAGTHTYFSGFGEYDFYCHTGLSLYGYRLDKKSKTAQGELLVTWLNCDIEGAGVLTVGENAAGDLACISYSTTLGGELASLAETESNTDSVQTLTLACRGLESTMAQQILRFNRQNNGYRVEVRDYGAAAVNNGLAAGLDQLTVDLISGNAPDLFCTNGMDLQSLIGLNLLEDLWPYIDADTELGGREGVVQPVFNAMSRDGKLYEVTSGFAVRTMMADAELAGENFGWTMEQFWQVYESMEDCVSVGGRTFDRETMLDYMLSLYTQQLLKLENGVADFDTEEFAAMIRFFSLFPENRPEYSAESNLWCLEGRQLMQYTQLKNAFDYFENPLGYYDEKAVTYVGFPGVDGNGSAFYLESPVAMSAKSTQKEGAWQFLRMALLPENQASATPCDREMFPTNKAAYDLMLQDSMREFTITKNDGTLAPTHEIATASGGWIARQPMTQQQADDLWNYLENITVVWRQEENLSAILKEEISRFLAGQQDANAAANAAQSRVQLYLNERN